MWRIYIYSAFIFSVICENITQEEIRSCKTPNEEAGRCIPLTSCPILLEGVKAKNDTIINLARDSLCKTEGKIRFVCCSTQDHQFNNECTTPNNESGRCVALESCNAIFEGIKQLNSTVIDFAKKSACQPRGHVCCGKLNYLVNNHTQQEPVKMIPTLKTTAQQIEQIPSPKLKPPKTFPTRIYCGFQHRDDRYEVSEGTTLDEFPWLVLLLNRKLDTIWANHCLGTLISRRYIITTGLCLGVLNASETALKQAKEYVTYARLGEHNTNATLDCLGKGEMKECSENVEVDVEDIIIHPQFDFEVTGLQYNIGLVRLAKKVEFNDYVRPICLPAESFKLEIGDNFTTSGWGYSSWVFINSSIDLTNLNLTTAPTTKKRGIGILVPLETCSQVNPQIGQLTQEGYQYCVRENTDYGVCWDDFGAPLMSRDSSFQWQLEGMLSMITAQKCGKGVFHVYTNVYVHLDWIYQNIRD